MGRKSKDANTHQAQRILTEAAVDGARLVKKYINRGKGEGSVSSTKLKAAEIAISHALGTPRQKILLKTGVLTMQDLLELASKTGENGGENGGNLSKTDEKTDDTFQIVAKNTNKTDNKNNKGNGHKEAISE